MSDAIREAFEADVTQIAERHKYQHMGKLLERLSDGCYRQSWVDSAWIGYCAAHARYALQALQHSGEPVARVIDDGTPEGATEWILFCNRIVPLKTGDLLYTTPQPVVPEGYVLVPRAAATEVLRTSSNRGGAWEEIRAALLSAGKGGE